MEEQVKRTFVSELVSYANHTNDWLAVLTCATRTHDWKVLRLVCQKKPKMDIASFEMFVKAYGMLRSMKGIHDTPVLVRESMEDLIFYHQLLPLNLETFNDFKRWNKALASFFVKSKECKSYEDDVIEQRVFGWWQNICKKHPVCVNIFEKMGEAELDVLGRTEWATLFSNDILFENGYYYLLLRYGQVDYLLRRGKANYVIENFDELLDNIFLSKEVCCRLARLVNEDMMVEYIRKNGRRRRHCPFFANHPQGLKVLVDARCSGIISLMKDDFLSVIEDFPEEFNCTPNARCSYISLLNGALGTSIPLP